MDAWDRIRKAAGWEENLLPGDVITGKEQGSRLRGMREHMRGLGFPVQDVDSHGYEQLGPSFHIPDTGHQVSIGHSRRDQTWVAHIHHPDDNGPEKTIATVNLGLNAEHVPHLLSREMGSRPVVDELRRQWARAAAGKHEYPGPRRPRDWGPSAVQFTARGAQLPEDPDGDF